MSDNELHLCPRCGKTKVSARLIKCEMRLARIAAIIEAVDNRCMAADGPVTPINVMTQDELSEIYGLAKGK